MSAGQETPGAAAPLPSQSQSMHPHFHPKRKTRGRRIFEAAMALLLVAIGIVIGAGIAVLYLSKHRPPPPRAKNVAENIVKNMGRKLALTPAELERIEEIATRRMENVENIRRDSFTRIRGEFNGMSDDFDEILGKERADLWEADLQERFGDRKWVKDRTEYRRRKHGDGSAHHGAH